jgi:hypothetical protein
MSTAAVFLDIEKAFDKTWHSGLLYKVSELRVEFSRSLIKLIASFLTDRKFNILVDGEFSTPKNCGRGFIMFRSCPNIVQSLYK